MGTYENPQSVSNSEGVNIGALSTQAVAANKAAEGYNTVIKDWNKLQAEKNKKYQKNQAAMEKARQQRWLNASKKIDTELSETEADYSTGGQSFDNTYLAWGKGIKDDLMRIELDPNSTAEQISKAEADALKNIENQQEFMGFFQGSLEDYKQRRELPKGDPNSILNSNTPGMTALYDDFVDNGGANITMNKANGTNQSMTYHNPKSILRDEESQEPILKDGKPQYMSREDFEKEFPEEVYAQDFDMSGYLKKNKNKNTQAYDPISYQPNVDELLADTIDGLQKDIGYGKSTQTESKDGKSVTRKIYDNEQYWESLTEPGNWDFILDSGVEGQAAGVWESMGNTTRWIGSGHDSVPPGADWNGDGTVDNKDKEAYQADVQIQRNLLSSQLAQKAYKESAQPDADIQSQRITKQKQNLAEKKAEAKRPLYKKNAEMAKSFTSSPEDKAVTLSRLSAANQGTTTYKTPKQIQEENGITDAELKEYMKTNSIDENAEIIAYKGDPNKNPRAVNTSDEESFDAALNKASGISDVEINMIKQGPPKTQSFSVDNPGVYQPVDADGNVIEASVQTEYQNSMNSQQGNDQQDPAIVPNTQYDSNPDSYGAVANQSGEAEWSFGDLKIKSSDFKNGALKTDGPNGYIHKLMNFEDSAGGFDGKAVSNYGFTGTGKEGAILLGKFKEYEKQGKNKAEAAEATINEYIIGSDPTVKKDGKPTILNELNISRGDFDKLPEDTKELLVGYKMNSGRDIADLLVIASGGDWDGRKAHRGSIDKNLVKAVDVANLTPNQLESARQQLYIGRIQSMQEMVDDPKNNKVSQNQVDTATKGWLNSQQHRSNFKFPEYSSKKEMEDDESLKPGESVFVVENGKKVKYIIQQQ